MAIICCPKGHNYDSTLYRKCPICETEAAYNLSAAYDKTFKLKDVEDEPTRKLCGADDEKTISAFAERLETDPVVGWLVCVEGPGRGRDYRLRAGRNFIGRSFRMSVSIVEDQQIAQENHASVIYESIESRFILLSGNGARTELNDVPVSGAADIQEGDRVRLGGSTFDFVAYCKGEKRWE